MKRSAIFPGAASSDYRRLTRLEALDEGFVIEKLEGNELKVRVKGETHTLGNLIAKELQKRSDVELAYYAVEHPLERNVVFYVKTRGAADPLEVFLEAVRSAYEGLDKLEKLVRCCFFGKEGRV